MLLLRVTDRLTCCHAGDPLAVPGEPAFPGTDWLLTAGQPTQAIRFTVRPLSALEFAEALAAPAGVEQNASLCRGLCLIDGQPANVAELAHGWQSEIALLVLQVTQGPMVGRRSPSTTGQ